jgi:thiamine biosynthesis lipoprotein
MATRFEIALHGDRPIALRAAGEEALSEIERLEDQLSLYRPHSDISRLNRCAAREAVRVDPAVFRLLQRARQLHDLTGGAFDISVGPLVRCWGFMGGDGRWPEAAEIAQARDQVGMQLVELDPVHRTVRFRRPGVMLDLGAIGKGYALEQAATILQEAGVQSALLHGGTSTIYALGAPPDEACWKVAVDAPQLLAWRGAHEPAVDPLTPPPPTSVAAIVPLRNQSLSVSAVWGRALRRADRLWGHVIDPRTGEPVRRALLAAIVLPCPTDTDALSTALLVDGTPGLPRICRAFPEARGLVVEPAAVAGEPARITAVGLDVPPAWHQSGDSPGP